MRIITILIFALSMLSLSPLSNADSSENSQVMLFGVFHFSNPGLDKVKTNQINVMSKENQLYLDALAKRLGKFKPTSVLLECNPEKSIQYQVKYQDYLNGKYKLPANENYQLGFRVAKIAGLQEVICYNNSFGWNAEPLFEYMPKHDPTAQQDFDALIAKLTKETSTNHQTLSLQQLLYLSNSDDDDRINKGIYILTNGVGAGDSFVGADAAASWWQRNFRMYANIQKVAKPRTRVLVFGGQGHTAILKDLLAIDQKRTAVDVKPYLSQ